MPKIDLPVTNGPVATADNKRWVSIPDKDMFDMGFPTIRINRLEFAPGRHYVDNDLADTIERLVATKVKGDVRVMSPKKDISSENAMNMYGIGARSGGRAASPESFG